MALKLFVWEDILCDYSCGIAVAMAHDVDEAREVLLRTAREQDNPAWHWCPSAQLAGAIAKEPEGVFDEPAGAFSFGGS
jgi:hypothetical protein